MDANLIHDIIFYVMYAALAIAVVILVERGLYFRGPSVRLCALKRR